MLSDQLTDRGHVGWVMAALLGGALSIGPRWLIPNAGFSDRLWCMFAGPLLAGFVIGLLWPECSWRWGVAAALPLTLSPLFEHRSLEALSFVVLLAFFALPSLLGADLAACARVGCEAFLELAHAEAARTYAGLSLQFRVADLAVFAEGLRGRWAFRGPEKRAWGSTYLYMEDPSGVAVIVYEGEV